MVRKGEELTGWVASVAIASQQAGDLVAAFADAGQPPLELRTALLEPLEREPPEPRRPGRQVPILRAFGRVDDGARAEEGERQEVEGVAERGEGGRGLGDLRGQRRHVLFIG